MFIDLPTMYCSRAFQKELAHFAAFSVLRVSRLSYYPMAKVVRQNHVPCKRDTERMIEVQYFEQTISSYLT